MGDDTNFLSEHWPTLAALAKGTTTCHFEEKGVCVCASVCESLSHIRLFVTPWTWGCKPWSLLGSSVHEILQARILERVAISFSRGSSQPRIEPCLLHWQVDSLPLCHLGSPPKTLHMHLVSNPTLLKLCRRMQDCYCLNPITHSSLTI